MKIIKGQGKEEILLTVGDNSITTEVEPYDETHDLCMFVVNGGRFEFLDQAVKFINVLINGE